MFWGVTESVHLVDIVNQTDYVEDPAREEKLGQPMINLSQVRDWGMLDFFVLPGSRERTLPGERGRLRSHPVTRADESRYESGAEEKHVDWAIRWSHTAGNWDVGLSHFCGTSRDPERELVFDEDGEAYFAPYTRSLTKTGSTSSTHWTTGFGSSS